MSIHSDKDLQTSQNKRAKKHTASVSTPQHHSPRELHQLQKTIGNQALQRLLAEGAVNLNGNMLQAKMTVGAPDDQYEQEADAVAEQVMTMPDKVQREDNLEEEVLLQTKLQREDIPEEEEPLQLKIQREENYEEEEVLLQTKLQREDIPEEEEEPLQLKSIGDVPEVSVDVEDTITSMKGNGDSMPDSAREFFEPRFGQDFSDVNVHTGAEADQLNRKLNARAFATGSDIFFRKGEYNPDSSNGRELLAHELTHVVQQGGSQDVPKTDDSDD